MKPPKPDIDVRIGTTRPHYSHVASCSDNKLRELLDLVADFFWETDNRHRIKKYLSRDGDVICQFSGKSIWELGGSPAYDEGQWSHFKSLFETHQPFHDFLIKQPFPHVGLRFLAISGRPLYSENGEFIGYHGITKNITHNSYFPFLLHVEKKIERQLNSCRSLTEAANLVVKVICESLLWPAGNYWSMSSSEEFLVQRASYYQNENSKGNKEKRLDLNKIDIRSQQIRSAIQTNHISWFKNDNQLNNPNGGEFKNSQGSCVIAFPLSVDGKTQGVFEFFSAGIIDHDERLVDLFDNIRIFLEPRFKNLEFLSGIEASRERTRYLMDQVEYWYWEVDSDYRYVNFSGKIVEQNPDIFDSFLGLQPWELTCIKGGGWEELLFLFNDRRNFKDKVYRLTIETGKTIDVSVSGEPIFGNDSNFLGYRGLVRDVTQREQVEQILAEKQLQLDVLLNSTDAGIYRIKIDPKTNELEMLQWDQNFSRLYGFSEEDQATAEDIINAIHPDDAKISNVLIQNAIKHGHGEHQNEFRVFLPDGSIRWLFTSARFLKDEDGKSVSMTGIIIDVTDKKLIENSLLETQEQLRTALYTTNIGLFKFSYDPEEDDGFNNDNILVWNFNLAQLFGYKKGEEVTSKDFFKNVHPEDLERTEKLMAEQFQNQETDHENEFRVIWPDGSLHWIYSRATIFYTREGKLKEIVGVSVDITERKLAEEKIEYLATHDSLTGLTNRNVLGQLINHEINTVKRNNSLFGVMFIDLDRFKVINDSLGHDAGDQLLKTMAERLQKCIRGGDIVSRLGGDEFVVLIRQMRSYYEAEMLGLRILKTISEPLTFNDRDYHVTASIGIAICPNDGEDENNLMKRADAAMYLAKREGKNNIQFYSSQMESKSLEKISLESDLRKAVSNNEFFLNYQAKIDASNNSVIGAEALIRWRHPEHGIISPDSFIPLAEETGAIISIGQWVLEEACRQAMSWQEQGLPSIRIAVNLSPRQFCDSALLNNITSVLRHTQLSPELLELEITESMVMTNSERSIKLLNNIKQLGICLSVDDFGTGYSSLELLKKFPIDTLKIDRSFIKHIPDDAEDKAIVQAVIAMAKSLNLTVIAEGVENQQQESFLKGLGCDQMQGYYFCKPISSADFTDYLKSKFREN